MTKGSRVRFKRDSVSVTRHHCLPWKGTVVKVTMVPGIGEFITVRWDGSVSNTHWGGVLVEVGYLEQLAEAAG